jgi:thiol-disulfide isomerase/thioredoxin
MRFKTLYIILGFLFVFRMEAQYLNRNFRLEAQIPDKTGKLYFGQYWKGNTYATDSVELSGGKAVFTMDKQPEPGEYFLFLRPSLLISLLIDKGQDNIYVSVNGANPLQSKVTGSEDTRLLWEYLAAKKTGDTDNACRQLIEKNPGTWFASYARSDTPVALPYPRPADEEEFYANKSYGEKYFFDNIDLTDPRLWRTNHLMAFIDSYMNEWISQIPDSLASAASRLVAKTKGNETCFKEMLSHFTNTSLKSGRMGDENVWAKLYEDYIEDKDIPWISPAQLSELKKKYEDIRYNRIGMKAYSLQLETMDGKPVNTGEIDTGFLILYFYNHDCQHCREEMPGLHDLYNIYKDKGVKVVTVNINNNKEEAQKFIKTHGPNDWINCMDPAYKSCFWLYYDTSGVPETYIINRNKTIVAKNINNESIKQFLEYYIK